MRLIVKNYPRKRVFFFLSLLLFSSCATKLVIPEPVAVPQVDIEDLARYSEAPIYITSQLPVLPAGGTSLNVDKTSLSLFNAGNRFTDWRGKDDYLAKVQPLLGKRCVSCHGCTDSPCRLKLTSYEGVKKGASGVNYYSVRIGEANDPKTEDGAKDFHPVVDVNGRDPLQTSLLYQLVQQGMQNTVDSDPQGGFDLEAIRKLQLKYDKKAKFQCVASEYGLEQYLEIHPLGGMPFGLPRLSQTQFATLRDWLLDGAKDPDPVNHRELYLPSKPAVIHRWEHWLNQDGNKARLMSRYLYEHLFLAHIHFDEMPGEFYQLVRARTASGQDSTVGAAAVDEIITSLPTDDPRMERVYYRLRKITETIVQKNHIVWRVNTRTLSVLDALFMQTPWEVPDHQIVLPGYDDTNPFSVYAQIPAILRHRFMLENSKLIIESMVRSPVCVGRSATYAIADHFWVFFLRPESDVSSGAPFYRLGPEAVRALNLDTQRITLKTKTRRRFNNNRMYINGYEKALRKDLEAQVQHGLRPAAGLGLGDIWDGGGNNPNAWLTVLRHDASTTVHHGQEGGLPQSIWVLSFANFERLYYNLVVNFKYWGNLRHKLGTWQSMSHERLDGEDLFISFLPPASRAAVRERYSGGMKLPAQLITGFIGTLTVGKRIERIIDLYPLQSQGRPALTSLPGKDRADHEFARLVQRRMSPRIKASADLLNCRLADDQNIYISPVQGKIPIPEIRDFDQWERSMREITEDRGKGRYAPYLPSITYLRVGSKGRYRLYTLISNRGYLSHNNVFFEDQERDPKRDTISIFHGAIGDYPELFLDVPMHKAADFLRWVQNINAHNHRVEMRSLKLDYGIRRNSTKFWPFVDWLHKTIVKQEDGYIYAGILDLSKYDLYDRN